MLHVGGARASNKMEQLNLATNYVNERHTFPSLRRLRVAVFSVSSMHYELFTTTEICSKRPTTTLC